MKQESYENACRLYPELKDFLTQNKDTSYDDIKRNLMN